MTYEEALQLDDLTKEERNRIDSALTPLYDNQPEAVPRDVGCDFYMIGVRNMGIERPEKAQVAEKNLLTFRDGCIKGWKVGLLFKGDPEPMDYTFLDQDDADRFASTMVFGSPTP